MHYLLRLHHRLLLFSWAEFDVTIWISFLQHCLTYKCFSDCQWPLQSCSLCHIVPHLLFVRPTCLTLGNIPCLNCPFQCRSALHFLVLFIADMKILIIIEALVNIPLSALLQCIINWSWSLFCFVAKQTMNFRSLPARGDTVSCILVDFSSPWSTMTKAKMSLIQWVQF